MSSRTRTRCGTGLFFHVSSSCQTACSGSNQPSHGRSSHGVGVAVGDGYGVGVGFSVGGGVGVGFEVVLGPGPGVLRPSVPGGGVRSLPCVVPPLLPGLGVSVCSGDGLGVGVGRLVVKYGYFVGVVSLCGGGGVSSLAWLCASGW